MRAARSVMTATGSRLFRASEVSTRRREHQQHRHAGGERELQLAEEPPLRAQRVCRTDHERPSAERARKREDAYGSAVALDRDIRAASRAGSGERTRQRGVAHVHGVQRHVHHRRERAAVGGDVATVRRRRADEHAALPVEDGDREVAEVHLIEHRRHRLPDVVSLRDEQRNRFADGRRRLGQRLVERGHGAAAHERVAAEGEGDHEQRQHARVPESEPRADRQRADHRRASVSSPRRYPAPRCVWMSGVSPGASTFRRSRFTYTSIAFDIGS